MKLQLKRIFTGTNYTIGKLSIDGTYFSDTLEDVPRTVKIMNETCIPVGTYTVILNYSNRFKRIMPLLLNVPNFDGIRIHAGNTSADTSGCILVGKNTIKGQLTQSRDTFNLLFAKLLNATDKITIEIS
jgi:hypothetical protein